MGLEGEELRENKRNLTLNSLASRTDPEFGISGDEELSRSPWTPTL
jgi:hypothetical protein